MRPAAFVDFRGISLDPAPDTTGVHWDAAFGHQRGHVFISPGVWEVPTDALHDHLTGKMAAFEGIGGRDRHAPPRYQTPPPNFATEPHLGTIEVEMTAMKQPAPTHAMSDQPPPPVSSVDTATLELLASWKDQEATT